MSWDVELRQHDEAVVIDLADVDLGPAWEANHRLTLGYRPTEMIADFSVTYNFGGLLRLLLFAAEPQAGWETLDNQCLRYFTGMTGQASAPILRRMIERCSTPMHQALAVSDPWQPTLGNVKYSLTLLLAGAEQHPAAVWSIH